MKIICVGWNYANHNTELNQPLPAEPTIFMKPETAILKDKEPFYIPDFSSEMHYELELVVKIDKMGKNISSKFAPRYYSSIGLGIDFTARDLQRKLQAEGKPWELCKAFDNSAVVGHFVSIADMPFSINEIPFTLKKNDKIVQNGNSVNMIFDINSLIEYISKFFTLKTGDLIFTGTPSGVGPVAVDDHLEGFLGEQKLLDCFVK